MLRLWQFWWHTCGSNMTCCHELVVTESLHWNLPQLEALKVTQDIMEAIHRCYERTGEIRFSPRRLKFLGDWQRNIFRINPSTILDILASTCLQMVSFKTFELTCFWCVWSHEKWQSQNDLSCKKLGCVFGYNPVSESGRMTAKAWRSTTLRWRHRVLCILCISDISVYCWKVGVRHDSPGNVGSFATAPAWNTTRSAIPETWMLQMSYSSRIPGMFCHRFGYPKSHPWGLLHAHHHRHGSCPKHWPFPHKDGQTCKWSKNNFMDWWECALSNMRRYPESRDIPFWRVSLSFWDT